MNCKLKKLMYLFLLGITFSSILIAQDSDEITADSDIFDTGKMWTFDFPPIQYLDETYDFKPSQEWFDDVRLSALRIPGCTASFISADGLIMTNNHCSPRHRDNVQLSGENLAETGFYAETLEDERKVPNMYAEQLAFIQDVTEEVTNAIEAGNTNKEKSENKENIINELVEKYNQETGLKCQFVTLFNGGKFSIYGYKKYEDVRMVFIPEQSIAAFGGDFDNFTYPRYDLDVTLYRVYDENDKPLNSEHFFKFSKDGVQKNEVIFSVGNPGNTDRLNTVAQIEYNRDISYRNRSFLLDEYYMILEDAKSEYPERADEFEKIKTRIGNSQKVFHYIQAGLLDPYLIARKRDFENKIKAQVEADSDLNEKYGHIWNSIKRLREELKPIDSQLAVYKSSRFFRAKYFDIARDIVEYANQMKLPETERMYKYQTSNIDSLKNILYPDSVDYVLENLKLQIQLDYIRMNLGDDNYLVTELCGDLYGTDAANDLLERSALSNKEIAMEFLNQSSEDILNSTEPFIYFIANTYNKIDSLSALKKEIEETEDVLVNMLGKVLYEIYGTEIPPDANFTLRISDGLMETFEYNGTIAIEKTTFFGMYDRYYGSDKTYPWDLPKRWEVPPADLDLSTVYNFISTNDIIGGNSGSAVINKDAEVVGLAFDGNVDSIIGNFIYLPENNRMVSVASQAIVESLDKVYKAKRIVEELKSGKISN